MNPKLLIDGIVRQTTVLIAQLSTASGGRSPLAHVADQVFIELSRELESQGVRRQVVADMFGLALRSYQRKTARLLESASARDRSLWEVVLDFVDSESPTRRRVIARFKQDDEKAVKAVLTDLVRSGLIYATGSADATSYGATSDAVRSQTHAERDTESLTNMLWLAVYKGQANTAESLMALFNAKASDIEQCLDELLASGRLSRVDDKLVSSNVVVPVGATQGWELALLDHFQTMATAIASKVRGGFRPSAHGDKTGGFTYRVTLSPEHPYRDRVEALLSKMRSDVQQLWDEVAAYNQANPPSSEVSSKLSFYAGQVLENDHEEN